MTPIGVWMHLIITIIIPCNYGKSHSLNHLFYIRVSGSVGLFSFRANSLGLNR